MADIFNIEVLKAQIGSDLAESLVTIVDGAATDVLNFGISIAENLVEVAFLPDGSEKEAMMAQLEAQTRALAEINRIRVSNEAWKRFDAIMGIASAITSTIVRNAVVAAGAA